MLTHNSWNYYQNLSWISRENSKERQSCLHGSFLLLYYVQDKGRHVMIFTKVPLEMMGMQRWGKRLIIIYYHRVLLGSRGNSSFIVTPSSCSSSSAVNVMFVINKMAARQVYTMTFSCKTEFVSTFSNHIGAMHGENHLHGQHYGRLRVGLNSWYAHQLYTKLHA